MAKSKKTKKLRIKRCVKRALRTVAVLTTLLCAVMVAYMVSLEYGIVTLDSKNQVKAKKATSSIAMDTSSTHQEVEMSVEVALDEPDDTTGLYQKQDDQAGTDEDKHKIGKQECEEASEGMLNSLEETQYAVGTIGEVDAENVRLLEETLHLIPTELLSYFYNNGWENCVTDEDIGETYMHNNNRYKAAIVWGKRLIIVEDRSEAIDSSIHELGHYLDGINNRPSYSDEFHQIYLDEVETFKANTVDGDCVHNQSEFFAQTFYYYILDPSKCTPKAYEYVETQLNILKERSSK